jgi:hypothetical protein
VQIQVKSDKNIKVDDRVVAFVQAEADHALGRYGRRLTRVEFHLSDVNSHKSGTLDKHCVVEARPAGHQPVVVKTAATTVRSAVHASLAKLQSALEKSIGRLEESPKHAAAGGAEAPKRTARKSSPARRSAA